MRALITGVTGFAGSFLAEHLLECHDEVLGTALTGVWPVESGDWPARRVPLVAWNLAVDCPGDARHAMEQFAPEAIYHLAAVSHPSDCRRDPASPAAGEPSERARAVNVDGTRRIVELAATLPSRPRVLLISSSHVYAGVTAAQPRVNEAAPVQPRDAYGRTKLEAEELVQRAVRDAGIHAVIARAFKHAGPRQTEQFMLAEWARPLAEGKPVRPYAPHSQVDLSDVRDVVRAYRLLVERGVPGRVYNVGSGENRRCGDIFRALWQLAFPSEPPPEEASRGAQEPIADLTRIATEIGWQCAIPLQVTLRDTLEYWRVHQRVRSSHSE